MIPAVASILRTGMVTPVGLGSEQTCLAIAAGVSAFAESSLCDRRFRPFVLACLPDEALPELRDEVVTPELTHRQRRLLQLASSALEEALVGVPRTDRIPLFLSVPPGSGGHTSFMSAVFLDLLQRQLGARLDVAGSRIFFQGRAGAMLALQAAVACLHHGGVDRVLVGGVDTHLDPHVLGTLDLQRRVLSASSRDGFVPGEAAAFLLLGSASAGTGVAHLSEVTSALEPGHLGSEEPYLGDGLASAVTSALRTLPSGHMIPTVYSSFNGESHWGKEWGVAFLRSRPRFAESHRLEHPADCVGDTGAAAGAVLLCLAAHDLRRGESGSSCLVWASSDGPERGVALLTRS